MSSRTRRAGTAQPQAADVFRRFAWNLAGTLKKRSAAKGRARRSTAR